MRSATKKLSPLHATKATARTKAKSYFRLELNKQHGLTKAEGTVVFRNLATLCSNGVSLTKAVGAVADERGLEKRRDLLLTLRRRLEAGDTFSHALSFLDDSFDTVTLSQIRVGERAGTLPKTLSQIADQREKAGKVREDIIKKLSYPIVLMVVGVAVVGFLLTYVVPVFEETYRSANVPLPWITEFLIQVGNVVQNYWWIILSTLVVAFVTLKKFRENDNYAKKIDGWLLTVPLLGPWLRDIAMLQLMEVLGRLMEAGFTLAEALEEAADSVGNRAMKSGVYDLHQAVMRGERFSRQIEKHSDLFPPMVSQLIIVGEQTGRLTHSTSDIRALLEVEIQRKSDIAVGVIEPVLTMSMAAAVAVILMAIYLPMFDMISTVS